MEQRRGREEDVKKVLHSTLSSDKAGKWLLIIDNADDDELLFGTDRSEGIIDCLPSSDEGLTLFTTRHQEIAQSLVGPDVIELQKMEEKEAVNFLEKLLVRKDLLRDQSLVTELLTELDYLPLAISQATAYINSTRSTIVEYLGLYKNTEQDAFAVMSREFRDNTRYKTSANAIAKIWIISFNQILEHDLLAANLLGFMSCIEWKAIPHSLLPVAQPEAQTASAIGTLCSYSFLARRDNERKYDMHRLVHLATRIWLLQNGRDVATKQEALQHLSQVFPSDDYSNREVWCEYLPHAARIRRGEE